MIIRIVKMSFHAPHIPEFKKLFEESKEKIRHFNGCTHLELLQQVNEPTVFFTYSHWESEEHLNEYRNSTLFTSVWDRTKMLFSQKPLAWSLKQEVVV